MSTFDVNQLLNSFLTAPKGNTPAEIIARMQHWADVYDHPELHTKGDAHPLAISAKKRSARQNLKRLIDKHPLLAKQALRERDNSAAATPTAPTSTEAA